MKSRPTVMKWIWFSIAAFGGICRALPTSRGLIVLDGKEVDVVGRVESKLRGEYGPNPWPTSVVSTAIFDVVGQLRLRGPLAQIDDLLEALSLDLAPYTLASSSNGTLASTVAMDRRTFIFTRESPSQLGADMYALHRLSTMTNSPGAPPRYFVDAGCHHPVRGSNTWLLESVGWFGVAVDANPLASAYARHRPRTRFVEALLWSESGQEQEFASSRQDGEDQSAFDGVLMTLGAHKEKVLGVTGGRTSTDGSSGSSSSDNSGSESSVSLSRSTTASATAAAAVLPATTNNTRRTQRTRSLASVLDQVGAPSVVDFMSLDVEGAEFEVLKSFPFHRYAFRLLCLEHNFEEPKRGLLRGLLESHGYAWRGEVLFDDVFEWRGSGMGEVGEGDTSDEGERRGREASPEANPEAGSSGTGSNTEAAGLVHSQVELQTSDGTGAGGAGEGLGVSTSGGGADGDTGMSGCPPDSDPVRFCWSYKSASDIEQSVRNAGVLL